MVGFWRDRQRWGWVGAVAAGFVLAGPVDALAHVKWFAPYDVPSQPRVLSQLVTTTLFWQPVACALLALLITCFLERGLLGRSVLRTLDLISEGLRPRIDDLYRAGTGAFLVAIAVRGGVILTPELKTSVSQIPWIQIALALLLFWRGTMAVSALGIAGLYVYAVTQYGIFHLLDYPIFLGLAAYLALSGLDRNFMGMRPLDVSRWAAAVTLIWASVEKWAYPQWTYPVLQSHPDLAMGFYADYYMNAAGVVEFTLAFGLLWTPLVRRLSALVLTAMFISAVGPFGMIDAIGHLMVIVILIGILVDDQPSAPKPPLRVIGYYVGTLVMDLAAYYGFHAALFRTLIW
jgi:hypothetical protein